MPRNTSIVCTTIFPPNFLEGFLAEIRESGCRETTTIYIIGDRKTPESVWKATAHARRNGFRVECPTLEEQESFLARIAAPADFIPYNSDNRRNVGFLMALESGCDVLISIDDDNFCRPGGEFLKSHDVVGSSGQNRFVRSSDGWFNICSLLQGPEGPPIFPRGFPYAAQRQARQVEFISAENPIPIAMNAGLWLDEPDVDAIYRLCRGGKMTAFTEAGVLLGPEIWSPINTQNTALTREAALTYYYVRMGFPLKGLSIDRFGDILSGYLTQKCVKHMRHAVRVGSPVLDHHRTPHNLFKDLYHELAGIVLIEDFLPFLKELRLEGTGYLDAYDSLAARISESAAKFTGFIWDDGGRDFLREMSASMTTWSHIVRRIAL
ncbi:MAG: hypothetical protein HY290_32675 [Planctomycetia bacterium]|nr:hypothetical protein [Planctomycetia bacterium]